MVALLLAASTTVAAEDIVGVAIKAQHFHGEWEQWNPGLTYEKRYATDGPATFNIGAGLIRDSIGNWSPNVFAGLGFEVNEHLVLGVDVVLLYRARNLDGDKVGMKIAPLPFVELWYDNVGLGFVLIPPPSDHPRDSGSTLVSFKYRF